MASLAVEIVSRTGLQPTYNSAAAGGDQFANSGREYIEVVNGDASPHTVTVDTPNTVDGLAISDLAVAVPAGERRKIGPFPPSIYNDGDGNVQLTYDAVTSVTVGVFRVP